MTTKILPKISNAHHRLSIGFSGAGFLGCYHLGVAECLVKNGLLLGPMDIPLTPSSCKPPAPIMLGASAGAITAAAISAGVRAEDGMNVVFELRRRVKSQGGVFDVLYPGVSLIDHVWELMLPVMQQALGNDDELLMRRIQHGKLLRIALTHKQRFLASSSPLDMDDSASADARKTGIATPVDVVKARTKQFINKQSAQVSNSYLYVDSYRTIQDVASACILSSYIPGLTGPARGVNDATNTGIRDATVKLLELLELGAVKDGKSDKALSMSDVLPSDTVDKASNASEKTEGGTTKVEERATSLIEPFWDGGLSCIWPTVDDSTIIVCPIRAKYDPNPAIFPAINKNEEENVIKTGAESRDGLSNVALAVERKIKTMFAASASTGGTKRASTSSSWSVPFHGKEVQLGIDNVETLMRMVISSDEAILEEWFHRGYNDAKRFLKDSGMLQVYTS